MTFDEKLIYLRRQSRCSQEALAEDLNVTRQTISKWELGVSQPTMDMIVRLSDYFHVSTDFLLRDDAQVGDQDVLARLVIRFLNSAQSMEDMSKELVDIARDGIIDEDEKIRLKTITKTIAEVQGMIDEIQMMLKAVQGDGAESE